MALTDKMVRPGLLQRAASVVADAIAGISGNTFMSPQQPLHAMAEGTKGRTWDYPVAYNINYIPRSNEPINFPKLKQLAEYGIVREVIQTRIDQMCSLEWVIRPKEITRGKPMASPGQSSGKIKDITSFLEYPDKRLDWAQWLNGVLEQHYVYDGVPVYRQKTRGGDPYSFTCVDAATLKVLIDADGRAHPPPPSPAYQQILKGVPTSNYSAFSANDGPVFTKGEMLYLVKNFRVDRAYGFPPGAQIMEYVEMTIARAREQLAEYTHGNSPQGLIQAPENYTAADINSAQMLWDSIFAGNIEQRRRLWWVPYGSDYKPLEREMLFDAFDEWLARVVCFAFSVSPTPFIKQSNRATADSAQETALAEGLQPTMKFVTRMMNRFVSQDFKSPELEFAFVEDTEFDPSKKAIIDNTYARLSAISIDEVREGIGRDPLGGPFAKPMYATPNGWVPVDPQEAADLKPAPPPPGVGGLPFGHPAMALPGEAKPGEGAAGAAGGKQPPKDAANASDKGSDKANKNVGRSLYIHRDLVNAHAVHNWAAEQGITGLLDADDMNVTQIYCRDLLDWQSIPKDINHTLLVEGDKRALDQFGEGALVMKIDSPELNARFGELTGVGASHSFDDYQSHVTLGYNCKIDGSVTSTTGNKGSAAQKVETRPATFADIEPYAGPLIFGEEVWREVDDDWQKMINKVVGSPLDDHTTTAPTPPDPREQNNSYGIDTGDHRQYVEEPPDYQQKARKQDKADVNYSAGKPNAHCGICQHFIAPNACKLVEGEIAGDAWCKLFEKEANLEKVYRSISDLPEAVTNNLKSPTKRRQWMKVFNSIYGDTKDEARAFAGAWSAVKKSDHDHYAYF